MKSVAIQKVLTSREYRVMKCDPAALTSIPVPTSMRGSTRPTSRPTMIIATAVATPRGAITRPVVTIG